MRTTLFLIVALVLFSSTAKANNNFWKNREQGWFWYETNPEKDVVPEDQPPTNESPEATPETLLKSEPEQKQSEPEKHGPAPLSHAWIKENLPLLQARAIDNPTVENVRAFYYVQRVMMDKSEKFATVAEQVVQGDPYIDETIRRPTATYAANAMNAEASEAAGKALDSLAEQAGILFFFRSDCGPCHVLAPVLKRFTDTYGFSVLPVSLDGRGLPSRIFPNFQKDDGQAAYMGVDITPSLFLMAPKRKSMTPIAIGAVSFTDLHRKTLIAAMEAGWITQDQFDATRAVRQVHKPLIAPLTNDDTLLDDPGRLVAVIREHMAER